MSVAQLAARRALPAAFRRASAAGWLTIASIAWIAIVIVVAVAAPLISPYDPAAVDLLNASAPPSAAHLLGTDENGRDILSRLLAATAPTLGGPALVVLAAGFVAVVLALVMSWFGGWVDALLQRAIDIAFAFPGLVVAIIAVSIFGPGFVAPVVALAIAYAPIMARVLRSSAMGQRNLPYVAALTVQGASVPRIWLRHLLPNLAPIVIAQLVVSFSYAMLDLAAISYLGLGLQPPDADWGLMISSGQQALLAGQPTQALAAAALIMITVVALNVLGDRIAEQAEGGMR